MDDFSYYDCELPWLVKDYHASGFDVFLYLFDGKEIKIYDDYLEHDLRREWQKGKMHWIIKWCSDCGVNFDIVPVRPEWYEYHSEKYLEYNGKVFQKFPMDGNFRKIYKIESSPEYVVFYSEDGTEYISNIKEAFQLAKEVANWGRCDLQVAFVWVGEKPQIQVDYRVGQYYYGWTTVLGSFDCPWKINRVYLETDTKGNTFAVIETRAGYRKITGDQELIDAVASVDWGDGQLPKVVIDYEDRYLLKPFND